MACPSDVSIKILDGEKSPVLLEPAGVPSGAEGMSGVLLSPDASTAPSCRGLAALPLLACMTQIWENLELSWICFSYQNC